MDTLNLGGRVEQDDNFFQRLFWPTVRNQYDVDLTARRGFWVAFAVGVLSAAVLVLQAHPLLAMFTLLVFLLGASGVRLRSLPAAILVFALYFTGIAIQWTAALLGRAHVGNPVVTLVCLALLLSCVRAAIRSRQFVTCGDTEFPASGSSAMDAVADRFPRAVWPRTRVLFFVLAGLYLVLIMAGAVAFLTHETSGQGHRDNVETLEVQP